MRTLIPALLILCAAGGLTAAEPATPPKDGAKAAKPAPLTVADLPAAVKTAMEKQADGATLERIKANESGGEKSYTARFTKGDVRSEVQVGADGRLLKMKAERKSTEASVALDNLPEAVRTVVAARVGDGKVAEVEQEVDDGKMVYNVEIAKGTDMLTLQVSADGTITKDETKPAEVKKAKGADGKKEGKKEGKKADKEALPATDPAAN